MNQLSFFSADTVPPEIADLDGLLAGPGQIVATADRARVSVVVDAQWRADAIAEMIEDAGLVAELTRSDEGSPLVRTASVPELAVLAARWTRGAVKSVPSGWVPGPRALRAWALAAGRADNDGSRFVLGLDPHAPDTHPVLAQSLMRAGVAPTLFGTRGTGPGLRIVGHRRLLRLVENIGEPPPGAEAVAAWPRV
ncbi:conserved hypothetical protein [Rhodococcus sp. RD6.2]|uniref:hypothetical protein n=1 Tax=unclassified Rhodococcus (in: high G+C Gram-positive bacteria) TaxID=192944 RepID=UPI00063B49CD|nr:MULTISPECIES: hypothetical protein [unclassified Rhodococcus (in: high G+C Gram-positive bacteria)]CRK50105.1 conserved hypothetical protein [Rhodococcus sp. RD6.2]